MEPRWKLIHGRPVVCATSRRWSRKNMAGESGNTARASASGSRRIKVLTYVATIVEVEVNDQGEVRIPRVDTALDAGLVVNPEATRAQFQGAAVLCTSVARTGQITATEGAIDQSNCHD